MVVSEVGYISDIFILSTPSYFSACSGKTTVWKGGCLIRLVFCPQVERNSPLKHNQTKQLLVE